MNNPLTARREIIRVLGFLLCAALTLALPLSAPDGAEAQSDTEQISIMLNLEEIEEISSSHSPLVFNLGALNYPGAGSLTSGEVMNANLTLSWSTNQPDRVIRVCLENELENLARDARSGQELSEAYFKVDAVDDSSIGFVTLQDRGSAALCGNDEALLIDDVGNSSGSSILDFRVRSDVRDGSFQNNAGIKYILEEA